MFWGPLITTWLYTETCHEDGDDGPRLDLLTTVFLPFQDDVTPGMVGCSFTLASPVSRAISSFFLGLASLVLGIVIGIPVSCAGRQDCDTWDTCHQECPPLPTKPDVWWFVVCVSDVLTCLSQMRTWPVLTTDAGIGRFMGAYNKHLYHTGLGADDREEEMSAIKVSARDGHVEVMAELVGRVGQWDQQTLIVFREAFELAAQYGHDSVMKVLVSRIEQWDQQALDIILDAFKLAVQHDSLKVVSFLLEFLQPGHNFRAPLPNDDRWLENSIRTGAFECTKLFHARGGDLNQLCEGGSTLREWVREHGTEAIARWLPDDVLERCYLERYKRDGETKYISETCSVWFAVDRD